MSLRRPMTSVPVIDRQVLGSLCTAVLRAKLDAQSTLEDLSKLPDNVHVDQLNYWQLEVHRLETGHAWLLDLLTAQP
jgi:hypothetical protein